MSHPSVSPCGTWQTIHITTAYSDTVLPWRLRLDFLLGGLQSHTASCLLAGTPLLFKGCLIQLAQFTVLGDTMRITLVVAACVAVVLLGQARTSSSQVRYQFLHYIHVCI